mmetsp:Transcript_14840/g.40610  ORF Transcript_14840/g.40610 Transcript_14840/m.40610 type:complete len:313 (-) Transcript_14840:1461-2399(-)
MSHLTSRRGRLVRARTCATITRFIVTKPPKQPGLRPTPQGRQLHQRDDTQRRSMTTRGVGQGAPSEQRTQATSRVPRTALGERWRRCGNFCRLQQVTVETRKKTGKVMQGQLQQLCRLPQMMQGQPEQASIERTNAHCLPSGPTGQSSGETFAKQRGGRSAKHWRVRRATRERSRGWRQESKSRVHRTGARGILREKKLQAVWPESPAELISLASRAGASGPTPRAAATSPRAPPPARGGGSRLYHDLATLDFLAFRRRCHRLGRLEIEHHIPNLLLKVLDGLVLLLDDSLQALFFCFVRFLVGNKRFIHLL